MNTFYIAVITTIGAFLSGVLYRLGGAKGWNTKYRDFGCPLILIAVVVLSGHWHWTLIPSAILMFGSLCTYWDKWGTDDVEWYEWMVTGFFYGMSMLPYAIGTGHYVGFIMRTIFLTVLTMLWSEYHDDVIFEEGGRGALLIISAPLLFLW